MTKKQKKNLIRIIISAVLSVGLYVFFAVAEHRGFIARKVTRVLKPSLFILPYIVCGYDVLIKAFKGIIKGQAFDENFLMAVATIGAMALGEYVEGVAVMVFYQTGELFQSIAIGKSRKSISALMDICPEYANLETEKGIAQVDPQEVEIGGVIVVRPGEKIPIDGQVIFGSTQVDASSLTGESLPKDLGVGDFATSGCVNVSGLIKIKTTALYQNSTVARIAELTENASSKKSKSEKFISKFAHIYTPAVCISALVLAVLPPVILLIAGRNANFGEWIYRALTFLVISCPCALVISIPLGFFASIGGASRQGILVKGSDSIESLSKAKYFLFDKTGTMTQGRFSVSEINPVGIDKGELLRLTAGAESQSNHPIATSIAKYYGKGDYTLSDVKELGGKGVKAVVDGKEIYVGNDKLILEKFPEIALPKSDFTCVYTVADGKYVGQIVLKDELKPTSCKCVENLKNAGAKTVMLTGDNTDTAKIVAEQLGVHEYHAKLLPTDKVEYAERYIKKAKRGEKVVFVGDGVNDAPVLARADVGISMGGMGSDASVEASDVVITDDNPIKIYKAFKMAKRCMRIIKENIYFAIGVKLVCLILGACGIANLWLSILADVGVMVIAVLNAIRLLKVK